MAVSVFVASPDTIYIELLRERLESRQVFVTGRTTHTEVLSFLRGIRPDLIVVDAAIESASDLLGVLRSEWSETPTIVIASDEKAQMEARQKGFDRVTQKSASPDAMLHMAVELLSSALLKRDESEPRTTLIVDDDPDVLRLFEKILSDHGFLAESALTVSEAMDVLRVRSSNIGLVLLDLVLPGGSGLEFLRRIQQEETPPTVILVSGVEDEALAEQAHEWGAFDYLVKPLDPPSLMFAVIAGMAESQRRGE